MRVLAACCAMILALIAAPALAQIVPAAVTGRAEPPATTDKENLWLLDLSDGGRVTIWLRPDVAPLMVERIKTLTRQHFYDGLVFHRVIDGFMAQGGDPKGDGSGGSTLPDLKAEFNYLPHVRGAVAAARAEANDSANSQFYIMLQPNLRLDRKYTVFGRVLEGMDFVDAVQRGEPPTNPTRITRAYIAADNPPAYTPAPVAAEPALPSLPAKPTKATPKPSPTAAPKRR